VCHNCGGKGWAKTGIGISIIMGDIINLEDYKDGVAQKELEGIQDDLDVVKEEVERIFTDMGLDIVPTIWGVPMYDLQSETSYGWHPKFLNDDNPSTSEMAECLTRAMLVLDQLGHDHLADSLSDVINKIFTESMDEE
jgi:hypothetical protein